MRVFLTGATGFVGMEVLARLLERGDEVACLVRAPDAQAARERLDGVLDLLWTDPAPYREGVEVVLGDVTTGVPAARADVAVHCAASITFDLPLEQAREINVRGTRRVLEAVDAERFVHVSTAYVAGTHRGRFGERELLAGQEYRNTYERTKSEAEQMLDDAGVPVAIARPSIVMGESRSGWTPAFNVLYWPLRAFSRGLFDSVPALAQARVDVVPVDYVADGIVALTDSDEVGAFNLTASDDAPTAQELLALACERFGVKRPSIVPPGSPIGSGVEEHGAVYLPYFDMEVVFDAARARELLPGPPRLADYFDALVDYAQAARWGKRRINREDALPVTA